MSSVVHQSQNTNIITLTAYLYDYTSNPGPIGIKHFHKNYELLIPIKGTSEVYVNDVKYILKPDCALMIHPYQTHHIQELGEKSLLWCSTFSSSLVSSFTSPLEGKTQQSPIFYPSKQCIEYFLFQMQSNFGTFKSWGKLSKQQILVAKSCFYGIGCEYLKQVNLKKLEMPKTRENLII